jgi:serine/threonine protein kinase
MAAPNSPAPSGPKGADDRVSEENLATTNAQLIVTLQKVSQIPVQDASQFTGLYCIITFDKQQVLSDSSMAVATIAKDKKVFIGCEFHDIVKFDVTQSLTTSYISVSVWGKNAEGTMSLGSSRFPLSTLTDLGGQDVDIPIRLNKDRTMIPVSTASPGSGKLGKSPMRSPGFVTPGRAGIDMPKISGAHPASSHTSAKSSGSSSKDSGSESSLNSPDSGSTSTYANLSVHIRIERQKRKVSESDFERLRVIGRGTFGKVFQARKKDTGRIYAMKVLKKDHVVKNNAVKHTMSENHVLKNINHPFIVNLKYAFQTSSHLYMVIDYLNGGELFYHLTHDDYFLEPRAKLYAAEVVSALGYLHEHHILYRDLKPENLLLDMHGHVCLVDFGLCKVGWQPNTQTHTFCGSAEYLSPELLRGKGYGKEVDWWALGVLIYEMLSGLPPFWDEDEEYMQKKIVSAPLKMHKYFSNEVKDIIRALLNRDPEQRLGTGPNGTQQIKNHPWFADIDWAALDRREIVPQFVPHLKNEQDLPYVEPEVLSEIPALSLTTGGINLDADLFAGFSYDSEMIHMHMAKPSSTSSKRGSARRDGGAIRRARADSAAADSEDSDDNASTPSTGRARESAPSSGRLRKSNNSASPSVKTESGLMFDLEDSGDL